MQMNKCLVALSLIIAGCSSTPEALEKSEGAARAEKTYAENYQEVYRRLSSTARRCSGGSSGKYTSFELDSELYNELGYGEVTLSLSNFGARNYYWKAKVTKTGSGALVTAVAGNTLAKNVDLRRVMRWADGDTGC